MTPIERAARAAAEYYGEDWDKLPDMNPVQNGDLDREHFIETARAVLQAIREPDRAVLEAGGARLWAGSRDKADKLATEVWQAMIDTALEEGQ